MQISLGRFANHKQYFEPDASTIKHNLKLLLISETQKNVKI